MGRKLEGYDFVRISHRDAQRVKRSDDGLVIAKRRS